jgi:hypothetical protein
LGKCWYLARSKWSPKEDRYGGTFDSFYTWCCAACLNPYKASRLYKQRLIVFGMANLMVNLGIPLEGSGAIHTAGMHGLDPMCCYVGANQHTGSLPPAQEGQLNLLKGGQLLREIKAGWWSEKAVVVTKEVVLQALERLNERSTKKLMHAVRTVKIKGAPFSRGTIQGTKGMRLFCEDPRQSLPQEGEEYFALVIDHNKTPTLTQGELQTIIDFCAAFINCDALATEVRAKYKSQSKQRLYANQLWTNGEAKLKRLDPRSKI